MLVHKLRSADSKLNPFSLTKVALKRRASSLEAVAHDLFEENQNLKDSLKGEVKKRTKEGSMSFFLKINIHTNPS